MQLPTKLPDEGKLIENSFLAGTPLPFLGRGNPGQRAQSHKQPAGSPQLLRLALRLGAPHREFCPREESEQGRKMFHSQHFSYSLTVRNISRNSAILKAER